jgi:hypothetical protein
MSLSGQVFIVTGALDALLHAGVDLSQKAAAAAIVEVACTVAAEIDGCVNLTGEFHRDKPEGTGDSQLLPDVLVQRAHQSNIGDAGPIGLIARRRVKGRRKSHMRTSFLQWNRESQWLAFNRCIAGTEWTTPMHSWIARQRE